MEEEMNTKGKMTSDEMKDLKKKIIIRFSLFPLFISLLVLLPAGTFKFWPVYVYFLILSIPMIYTILYFIKNNPEFLKRRIKAKEKEREQKVVVLLSSLVFFIGFMLPGFDHRFGWSNVPIYLIVISDLLVLFGYIFVISVFKENSYASRIVEVSKNQTVISTGTYSLVRHPMYLGVSIMFLATPLALGSYWGLIPFIAIPILLIPRILNEEKVLSEQLPNYKEYCRKVKYRMIPFIW
jgi:protein-S-isoprenylcysteine O-methyltransferase Ste14